MDKKLTMYHLNPAYQIPVDRADKSPNLISASPSISEFSAIPRMRLGREFQDKDQNDQTKEIADHFTLSLIRSGVFMGAIFVGALWLGYTLLASVTLVFGGILGVGSLLWNYFNPGTKASDQTTEERLIFQSESREQIIQAIDSGFDLKDKAQRPETSHNSQARESVEDKINRRGKTLFTQYSHQPLAKAPSLRPLSNQNLESSYLTTEAISGSEMQYYLK